MAYSELYAQWDTKNSLWGVTSSAPEAPEVTVSIRKVNPPKRPSRPVIAFSAMIVFGSIILGVGFNATLRSAGVFDDGGHIVEFKIKSCVTESVCTGTYSDNGEQIEATYFPEGKGRFFEGDVARGTVYPHSKWTVYATSGIPIGFSLAIAFVGVVLMCVGSVKLFRHLRAAELEKPNSEVKARVDKAAEKRARRAKIRKTNRNTEGDRK